MADARFGDVVRVLRGEPVSYRYPGLLEPGFEFISGFLFRVLNELDLGYLSELVVVLLKEMIFNSSKAVAKRVYFEEQKLDITNSAQYARGMEGFGNTVLRNWDEFRLAHDASKYEIHVDLKLTETDLELVIRNNVMLVPDEENRIRARFKVFSETSDVHATMERVRDDTEGAGLGIVLVLVLLQNAGIAPGNFNIQSRGGQTITFIRIPRKLRPVEVKAKFTKQILAEIDGLPSFPQNITTVLQLCNSTSASLPEIAQEIAKDPALTAQIIKLVHSAGYITRVKNPTVLDAVKIIGLKMVRNLLLVSGARNIISSKYRVKDLETIWEAANRVSFFARTLAPRPEVADAVVVSGLLFELGKIVLLSLDPETIKGIAKMVGSGRIRNSSIMEEITIGMGHPEVGGRLAERWNFPEGLTTMIRYQQKPLQAPEAYRDGVRTLYMAIRLHEAANAATTYHSVEPEVMESFHIDSAEKFQQRVTGLEQLYNSQNTAE